MDIRKDIRVDWITVDSFKDRHLKIKSLFESLGFDDTNQINGKPIERAGLERSAEVGRAHAKALENPGQVLVFEDDVQVTSSFSPTLENIPTDADAIYLGVSKYGVPFKNPAPPLGYRPMFSCYSNPYRNATRYQKIDETWDKPLNMLGIHAVIYLTESYKKQTIQNFSIAVETGIPCDVPIAVDMKNHNIYSPVHPWFYQTNGNNAAATNLSLRGRFPCDP